MALLSRAGYRYVPGPTGQPWDLVLRQEADLAKGFEWKGQEHYDMLGAGVTEFLEERLEADCKLERVLLSEDDGASSVPVFVTPDLQRHTGPLLLLVAGSAPGGHAGMWARSLCVNDSLAAGSMFPYVQRAQEAGWAVVVANPNVNRRGETRIPGSETPHLHLLTLWRRLLEPCRATPLLVVAHSYGGCAVVHLLKTCPTIHARLGAVAFTDAGAFALGSLLQEVVPSDEGHKMFATLQLYRQLAPAAFQPVVPAVEDIVAQKVINFQAAEQPAGSPLPAADGCACASAGHPEHVWTSAKAINEVFAFLHAALAGPVVDYVRRVREMGTAAGSGTPMTNDAGS